MHTKESLLDSANVYEILRLCDCNFVCVVKFSSSTDGVVAIVQLLTTCGLPILEFSFATLSDVPQNIKDIVFQQAFYSGVLSCSYSQRNSFLTNVWL